MFKKFKDKLAEEMKQSPARLQASVQQFAQVALFSLLRAFQRNSAKVTISLLLLLFLAGGGVAGPVQQLHSGRVGIE